MTDIFISYSSKDKNVADAICAKLEQNKLKCWIAPRDINPGEEYAAGIVRGIDNCKCMVIVFSEDSNNSKHVLREVERAVGLGIVVIPFRITDIMPTDSMDYFLKVAHWLDAMNMEMDTAINKLTETIAKFLEQPIETLQSNTNEKAEVNAKNNNKNKYLIMFLSVVVIGVALFSFLMKDTLFNKTPAVQKISKASMLNNLIQQNKVLLNDASRKNIESTLDISLQIPNRALNIKTWLEPDRSQFMEDDKIKFRVTLDNNAYLAVYVHSMDGNTYLIYPNPFAAPEKIAKNTLFTVGNGGTYKLVIGPPFGIDLVQFIATTDEDEFKKLLSKHTPLKGMNIATANRGVLVQEMKGINARGIIVQSDTPQDESVTGKLWGEALILLNTREKE